MRALPLVGIGMIIGAVLVWFGETVQPGTTAVQHIGLIAFGVSLMCLATGWRRDEIPPPRTIGTLYTELDVSTPDLYREVSPFPNGLVQYSRKGKKISKDVVFTTRSRYPVAPRYGAKRW